MLGLGTMKQIDWEERRGEWKCLSSWSIPCTDFCTIASGGGEGRERKDPFGAEWKGHVLSLGIPQSSFI